MRGEVVFAFGAEEFRVSRRDVDLTLFSCRPDDDRLTDFAFVVLRVDCLRPTSPPDERFLLVLFISKRFDSRFFSIFVIRVPSAGFLFNVERSFFVYDLVAGAPVTKISLLFEAFPR